MTTEIYLLISALLFGLYAAWNIGANDVSNAMGTSVGSKALTLKQAVIIAAIFEFSGAILFGSHVSETLQRGIVDPTVFSSNPYHLVYGMLASLLAAGIWLQLATYFGLPVSTTHAIVGAIVGFGMVGGGLEAIYWDKVAYIACSWIISPLLGAGISFLLFSFLRKRIFYSKSPLRATKEALPWIVASVVIVLCFIGMWNGIAPKSNFLIRLGIVFGIAAIAGFTARQLCKYIRPKLAVAEVSHTDPIIEESLDKAKKHLVRAQKASEGELNFHIGDILEEVDSCKFSLKQQPQHVHTEFYYVEKIFAVLQIITACLMAFSHGANDVANAIGPLAAIISILETGTTEFQAMIPTWILIIGGFGIVAGLATWGWKVIETIGKNITELTPSRGFSAEFGAALTVLFASRLGFPISTTHTLVGAVLGVGMARGIDALNIRMVRDIILAWIVTIPAGAAISIFCYYIIEQIF
jgi:inorganic phosphate transporter, PiT family